MTKIFRMHTYLNGYDINAYVKADDEQAAIEAFKRPALELINEAFRWQCDVADITQAFNDKHSDVLDEHDRDDIDKLLLDADRNCVIYDEGT